MRRRLQQLGLGRACCFACPAACEPVSGQFVVSGDFNQLLAILVATVGSFEAGLRSIWSVQPQFILWHEHKPLEPNGVDISGSILHIQIPQAKEGTLKANRMQPRAARPLQGTSAVPDVTSAASPAHQCPPLPRCRAAAAALRPLTAARPPWPPPAPPASHRRRYLLHAEPGRPSATARAAAAAAPPRARWPPSAQWSPGLCTQGDKRYCKPSVGVEAGLATLAVNRVVQGRYSALNSYQCSTESIGRREYVNAAP